MSARRKTSAARAVHVTRCLAGQTGSGSAMPSQALRALSGEVITSVSAEGESGNETLIFTL